MTNKKEMSGQNQLPFHFDHFRCSWASLWLRDRLNICVSEQLWLLLCNGTVDGAAGLQRCNRTVTLFLLLIPFLNFLSPVPVASIFMDW